MLKKSCLYINKPYTQTRTKHNAELKHSTCWKRPI